MKIVTSTLQVGDVIVEERGAANITVQHLEICKSHGKGVIRYHVNGSMCYDTLIPFTVHRSYRKES
jgi:hypothetical protein